MVYSITEELISVLGKESSFDFATSPRIQHSEEVEQRVNTPHRRCNRGNKHSVCKQLKHRVSHPGTRWQGWGINHGNRNCRNS